LDTLVLINGFAAFWFLFCWVGYSSFAKQKAKSRYSLSSVLHIYRKNWMQNMMKRENRISDTALIAGLERQTTFLASTSIFVIAGLVTIMAAIDKVHQTLSTLPFVNTDMTAIQLQFKIFLLLSVYVYAFFTLTWAIRQYGFAALLLGAAPLHNDASVSDEKRTSYAHSTAKVIDNAGHSYNYGLRAYYFSLSILPWFFNTWLFMITATLVVIVLYRREFFSRTLRTLIRDIELHRQ